MDVPHSEVAKLVGGSLEGLLEEFPVEGEVGQVVILEFEVGFVPL